MFRAVLSNPQHPEQGQVTVPFPLTGDAYPQTLELLRALDLGDPSGRDCRIDEISGGYFVLKRLEGGMVNLDELTIWPNGWRALTMTRASSSKPSLQPGTYPLSRTLST